MNSHQIVEKRSLDLHRDMAIILGDVHGDVEKVKAFLNHEPGKLHVVLGDYCDSFSEPPERQLEALELLLDSDSTLLWGNHDLHYLSHPPFFSPGYQPDQQLHQIIEANKSRFKAAFAVDNFLCTHAGVHSGLVFTKDVNALAERFNLKVAEFLENPRMMRDPIFNQGQSRGGTFKRGGIFWFDFQKEFGLSTEIKQVFGHVEVKKPVVTGSYVALDTTNLTDGCYVFDTSCQEVIFVRY